MPAGFQSNLRIRPMSTLATFGSILGSQFIQDFAQRFLNSVAKELVNIAQQRYQGMPEPRTTAWGTMRQMKIPYTGEYGSTFGYSNITLTPTGGTITIGSVRPVSRPYSIPLERGIPAGKLPWFSRPTRNKSMDSAYWRIREYLIKKLAASGTNRELRKRTFLLMEKMASMGVSPVKIWTGIITEPVVKGSQVPVEIGIKKEYSPRITGMAVREFNRLLVEYHQKKALPISEEIPARPMAIRRALKALLEG